MNDVFAADVEDNFEVQPRIRMAGSISRFGHCQNPRRCAASTHLLREDFEFMGTRAVLSQESLFEPRN